MFKIRVATRRDAFVLNVSVEVSATGVVSLFGRSGCGKTTLVNIIAGLLKADSSYIEIDGVVLEDTDANIHVPSEQRRIGYVFQDARLFPHLDVAANLDYGLRRSAKTSARTGMQSVIELLGLGSLLKRRPHQLSGGERQRVALGRALLSQPRVLLLDEPLASLDTARRAEVLPYLERLRDESAIPMIYVSHQYDEVLRLATHVVLMEEGRTLTQGALDVVGVHPELRAIIGPEMMGAVLLGVVEGANESTGLAVVRVGANVLNISLRGVRPGTSIRIHLLARDVLLATVRPEGMSVRNVLTGVVSRIASDDAETDLIYVDLGGTEVLARVTRAASVSLALRVGLSVWVLVKSVSISGHTFLAPALREL